MDLRDLYESGPPCMSRAGWFRSYRNCRPCVGSFHGFLRCHKRGPYWDSAGQLRVVLWHQAKSVVRNGLGWGFFAGIYLGLNCGVETVRRKSDWINAAVAGATTGALVAVRTGSGVKMLQTAALVSAIATAGDFIRPSHYPPTGI